MKLYAYNHSSASSISKEFSFPGVDVELKAYPAEGGNPSGSGVYVLGIDINISAGTNSGYSFLGWYMGDDLLSINENYTFTTSIEEYNLEARFELNSYIIDVATVPTASGSVTGTGTYDHGNIVTLMATANTGYTFLGWYEEDELVAATAEYQFTAEGARSLEARFIRNYGIGIIALPTEGGTVTGSGTYTEGSVAELEAIPAEGYRFVQWLEDGKEIGTEAKLDYTAIADATITAVFWPYDSVRTDSKTGIDIPEEPVVLHFHGNRVTMIVTSPEEITGGANRRNPL
ncbi:MAG: hypothetical protein FH749_04460 [Firmicutes bacterium]|nr:hypothetical protein [Bacillota bacterium]